jgi:hypothetical protein
MVEAKIEFLFLSKSILSTPNSEAEEDEIRDVQRASVFRR